MGQSQSMRDSPPLGPGPGSDSPQQRSPLLFTPITPMAPMPKGDDFVLGGSQPLYGPAGADYGAMAGWPVSPSLVPTLITWSHGGHEVAVEGSFDNWATRQAMLHSGKDFVAIKLLPPGVYQYKFIVDGEWKYAPEQAAMYDEIGNINNVLEVAEPLPDVQDHLHEFIPPSSPRASYGQPPPGADDFVKEPPGMPPHLELTLLNVPRIEVDPSLLPRPQHVILNHAYSERSLTGGAGVLVLGTTHRYRAKYISTILYKPGPRR